MTVIATALKHMLAAGMPHDAIVAAVMEMETGMAANTPLKQRSKAALRQERYEERKRQKTSESVSSDAEMTLPDAQASELTLSDAGDGENHPLPLPPNDINSNPPAPTPGKISRARKGRSKPEEPFTLPSWIPQENWDAFERMRDKIRKPMTDDARRLAVGKLQTLADAGWPPGDVLDQSTLNSWQGLFKITDNQHGNNRNGSNNRSGRGDGWSNTLSDVAGRETHDPYADDGGGMPSFEGMG